MKKLTTIIAAMLLGSVTWAQDDAISQFFSKYNDDPDFTQVTVTSKMFGLFTHFEPEDEDEEAVKNAISKISGLKILALENTQRGEDLYDEAFNLIPKNDYEELMTVNSSDADVVFLANQEGDIIKELILLVGGKGDDNALIYIAGNIRMKDVSKIAKSMGVDDDGGHMHIPGL